MPVEVENIEIKYWYAYIECVWCFYLPENEMNMAIGEPFLHFLMFHTIQQDQFWRKYLLYSQNIFRYAFADELEANSSVNELNIIFRR